jgi:hypothetical protein
MLKLVFMNKKQRKKEQKVLLIIDFEEKDAGRL